MEAQDDVGLPGEIAGLVALRCFYIKIRPLEIALERPLLFDRIVRSYGGQYGSKRYWFPVHTR